MMAQTAEKTKESQRGFSFTRWFSYTSSTETMRTWPKIITSADEIPENFGTGILPDMEEFPYMVFIPADIFLFANRAVRTKPLLVFMSNEKITVMEDNKGYIETISHYYNDIHYIKTYRILLAANITISSSSGISSLNFSAARDDFLQPFIEVFRNYYNKPEQKKIDGKDILKIKSADHIDYKFINYGMNSLLPDQIITDIVYQESINLKEEGIKFSGRQKKYSAPFLIIKTGDELIIIEEPTMIRSRRKLEYGGIYTFIPLRNINKIDIATGLLNKMIISLKNSESKEFYFLPGKSLTGFEMK